MFSITYTCVFRLTSVNRKTVQYYPRISDKNAYLRLGTKRYCGSVIFFMLLRTRCKCHL